MDAGFEKALPIFGLTIAKENPNNSLVDKQKE
jgi:hypothetical protein